MGNVGSAPVTSTGGGERFASPNGQLGAGLTASPEQKGRAFIEMGFGRAYASDTVGGVDVSAHITSLSWILGAGYKLTPELELIAMLPIAWADFGTSASGGGVDLNQSDSGFAAGNASVGVNYVKFGAPLRYMAGAALQWGPWNHDYGQAGGVAILSALAARGGQDFGLWAPDTLTVAVPGRVEYQMEQIVLGADAQLGFHVPTHGGDFELSAQLAPGLGFYASQTALIGLRIPFNWIPTESGSGSTYLAAEPYARFDFGSLFLATRFTLNLDEPFGFSFDSGKWWALHVGFGGSF